LTLLDFCKSIDELYKELRLLRLALQNDAHMNKTSEKLINIVYYFIVICCFLAALGINPFTLFMGVAGIVVGFAFMIGGASSKYFEGVLMVLVRRPYDIGDRIAIQNPTAEPSSGGAPGWIVKDLGLYHTTVVYGASQEYCTFSNGSLANCRIINANRSPRGVINFKLRFGIATEKEHIYELRDKLEAFVKERPREWVSFLAFRMTALVVEKSYVEYIVVLQHREGWHQIGAILTSLAAVQSHAFDISKEMKMGYVAPKMPIELTINNESPASPQDLQNMLSS
jgi:small-conductance mechanosensitive channel